MLHELNGLIQISHSVENYLFPLQITLVPHHVGQILIRWPLPSVILIIQCGAQNAKCCVKVMAFNGLPYADLI
jgi:hypothetical protein